LLFSIRDSWGALKYITRSSCPICWQAAPPYPTDSWDLVPTNYPINIAEMFSADITWTPIAESKAESKKQPKQESDNRSVQSSETSRTSRKLRWPLSRKPQSANQWLSISRQPLQQTGGVASTGQVSPLMTNQVHNEILSPSSPLNQNEDPKSSNRPGEHDTSARKDEVFELPAADVIEGHSIRMPTRVKTPDSRPSPLLSGRTEVNLLKS
jgi:hypothetical protein